MVRRKLETAPGLGTELIQEDADTVKVGKCEGKHFATFVKVCPKAWSECGMTLYTGGHYDPLGALDLPGSVPDDAIVHAALSHAGDRAGLGISFLQTEIPRR